MTDSLRIAILHYHLRRGGVTRVIDNAVGALKNHSVSSVVITGEKPSDGMFSETCVRTVSGLGYEGEGSLMEPEAMVERIQAAARDALGGPPDIWHIHNHALAKNLRWPAMVRRLADRNERLVLQIHDFAEDGRPRNYRDLREAYGAEDEWGAVVYPQAGHVHYALLNSRDRQSLLDAGFDPERTHLLPNAVWMEGDEERPEPTREETGRLFLYPTRAIRRKNLGEFLFWSGMAREGDRFAATLAPQNPRERQFYERWVEFAEAEQLPMAFEAGADVPFGTLLKSAHTLVTTSMAEGFGLAFLEPWLAGRPLAGRNLPEITEEFTGAGVDLSGLYERLWVPLDWIDRRAWMNRVRRELSHYLEAYGREFGEDHIERAVHASVNEGRVDFGRLDEPLQEEVIRKVHRSSDAHGEVQPAGLLNGVATDKVVERNRDIVKDQFGLPQYGRRLMRLYEQVMAGGCAEGTTVSAEAVLDQFLSPERFCLLRS